MSRNYICISGFRRYRRFKQHLTTWQLTVWLISILRRCCAMAFGGYNGIQWEMTPQIMQFSTLLFSVLLMGHMYLYMSLYVTIDEYRVVWETAKMTESTLFNKDWSMTEVFPNKQSGAAHLLIGWVPQVSGSSLGWMANMAIIYCPGRPSKLGQKSCTKYCDR